MPAENSVWAGPAGYIGFLAPGIIGMTLLFSSSMQGMSLLWDKEFGFLKEILVAPVSRVSLVLGRIAGGATTSMIQGLLIFGASMALGFRPRGAGALAFGLVFMLLIAFTFIGMGLIFARAVLLGRSSMPVALDLAVMAGFALAMLFLGAYFFEKSEAVQPTPGP